jgi:hypothetical protein
MQKNIQTKNTSSRNLQASIIRQARRAGHKTIHTLTFKGRIPGNFRYLCGRVLTNAPRNFRAVI